MRKYGESYVRITYKYGEIKKEKIIVSTKTETSKETLEKKYEVIATNDNIEVAAKANIIFLQLSLICFRKF